MDRSRSVSSHNSTSSLNTLTTPKSRRARLLDELSVPTPSFMDNDKSIKLMLKHFKRLELGLNKFNSKSDGIATTNILRTVLLPFLRSSSLNSLLVGISTTIGYKVYKSLVSILSSILIKWWTSLLNSLINSHTLSSIDRSAYLECISRIISRREWFHLEDGLVDAITVKAHDDILVLTLDYSIWKLASIKHLPLSICAFVGKVFAYGFFRLEGVSNALLFLLNIKQSVFEENRRVFRRHTQASPDDLTQLYATFPKHLHYLVGFDGLQNKDLSKHQKIFLNCLVPPKKEVPGIKDPNGLWVGRWLNSDSDIFNSFLRHYLHILHSTYSINNPVVSDGMLLNSPGLNIIMTHLFQILQISVSRISKNNSNLKINQDFQVMQKLSSSPAATSAKSNLQKQNDVFYNSVFKIFRTLRDLKFSLHLESATCDDKFMNSMIGYVEMILKSFASQMTIYEFNKSSLILNIIYEFVNSLGVIDWTFWLNCCHLMIENTDHIQILLKNISFLFNVWDKIPEIVPQVGANTGNIKWFSDCNKSFKVNFIGWLISSNIWEKFFLHWNPLVRNYYLRLLIWQVVGINNFESSTSIEISLEIQHKLDQSYATFNNFYAKNHDKNHYFKPDNPVINRKMAILPITKDEYLLNEITNQGDDEAGDLTNLFAPSELKKTHPFEIFDEAIYSCSSLPKEEDEDTSKRSNSLVNSIGKIFKMLTVDDSDITKEKKPSKIREFRSSSKSGSLTSLSTYSLKSRSSSPSIMSYNSSPTSLTDFSESSSSITTVSTVPSESADRLKSFTLPPEIVRPAYKFELVLDQNSIRDKHFLMANKNYVFRNHDYFKLPPTPTVPSISIYLQSDIYKKFYISTENYFLLVDDNQKSVFENGLFDSLDKGKSINYINLGKSLFEWSHLVEEFESYLINKVEVDQFNENITSNHELNEHDYFRKIIPLLSLDSNSKPLNAA
ncbi:hypothetical protein PSN45_000806 [Yamadazyma tenuis]|nr:hypothetical protein PSN45_000806 [Yamadazyma tenuis]